MRKVFALFFVFCSMVCYSQTWTEIEETGFERECTIITKEQYDRLLRQYEEDYGGCNLKYFDILEASSGNNVISGTRPVLRGYYHILIRRITGIGVYPALAYGNSNTGKMEIWFNPFGGMSVESNEYVQRYNQLIRRVNRE